ncbi:transcriptional regulator, MerR family [Agromyces sp. CF514]|uniref:MerR family transcriptional regulator n=1 Tax=Agromyces sp. CF514 TaxID=1881031 RepID=UPI0008E1696A|nr:MerR family transcriptional regulator [Agromyces sp. CF514]SFR72804.1 transcriptional regulator, MerR family [Agromyces sp. CF514]
MHELGTGEMSRASGLSLKALRVYEARGLLVPAAVDEVTGYRRYGEAELARARSIQALRRIGVPLARVHALLDAPPDALRGALTDWWSNERAVFAERSQVVDLVTDAASLAHLDPASASAVDARVHATQRPALKVASITHVVEQAELVPTSIAGVITLRRHLAEQGARPADAHWFVFHDPVGHGLPGRVEVVVPYSDTCDPADEIVLRVHPATAYVAVDVTAAELVYPSLLRFYDAVTRAAERRGGATGAPRELYERPWSTSPCEVVATIALPIAGP